MRAVPLLRLLQVTYTAFPTGAFAHSLALEAFHEAGELRGAEDLKRLVGTHIRTMSTSDCVALRAAHGEQDFVCLIHVDRLLGATKTAWELRAATGRRFLASVAALGVENETLATFTAAAREGATPGNAAVGYGVVGAAFGLGVPDTLYAYLFASVSSLAAAGQKLVPLGGGAVQRALYELGEEIVGAVEASGKVDIEEMYAFAPLVDARSMMHERQRTRLYIT